jgi:hypothetical protein
MQLGECAKALEDADPLAGADALRSLHARARRELAEARVAIAVFLGRVRADRRLTTND